MYRLVAYKRWVDNYRGPHAAALRYVWRRRDCGFHLVTHVVQRLRHSRRGHRRAALREVVLLERVLTEWEAADEINAERCGLEARGHREGWTGVGCGDRECGHCWACRDAEALYKAREAMQEAEDRMQEAERAYDGQRADDHDPTPIVVALRPCTAGRARRRAPRRRRSSARCRPTSGSSDDSPSPQPPSSSRLTAGALGVRS